MRNELGSLERHKTAASDALPPTLFRSGSETQSKSMLFIFKGLV